MVVMLLFVVIVAADDYVTYCGCSNNNNHNYKYCDGNIMEMILNNKIKNIYCINCYDEFKYGRMKLDRSSQFTIQIVNCELHSGKQFVIRIVNCEQRSGMQFVIRIANCQL